MSFKLSSDYGSGSNKWALLPDGRLKENFAVETKEQKGSEPARPPLYHILHKIESFNTVYASIQKRVCTV